MFHRRLMGRGDKARVAASAASGTVLRVESKVQQCVVVVAGNQDDIAAAAAVAAGRAAARNILFAPERETAVSAVTCLDPDSDFVDKHFGDKENGPDAHERS